MSGGYWGRVLRVDLSTETISIEKIEEQVYRKYIGGSGLGARYLFDETSPATDPLGPDGTSSVFVVDRSMPGHVDYDPAEWENFRFEFDFQGDPNAAPGVVWGGRDFAGSGAVEHGYLFYIDQMPTQAAILRAKWGEGNRGS